MDGAVGMVGGVDDNEGVEFFVIIFSSSGILPMSSMSCVLFFDLHFVIPICLQIESKSPFFTPFNISNADCFYKKLKQFIKKIITI